VALLFSIHPPPAVGMAQQPVGPILLHWRPAGELLDGHLPSPFARKERRLLNASLPMPLPRSPRPDRRPMALSLAGHFVGRFEPPNRVQCLQAASASIASSPGRMGSVSPGGRPVHQPRNAPGCLGEQLQASSKTMASGRAPSARSGGQVVGGPPLRERRVQRTRTALAAGTRPVGGPRAFLS